MKIGRSKKEVRDTRNVLEAAIAAGKPAAAKPVIDFLQANNNEHVQLKKIGARIGKPEMKRFSIALFLLVAMLPSQLCSGSQAE